MNLAYKDIRHNLGRFLLTCIGLGLLLGVVLAMIGIYRGLVADALTIARAPAVDLWAVGVIAFNCLSGASPFDGPSAFTSAH